MNMLIFICKIYYTDEGCSNIKGEGSERGRGGGGGGEGEGEGLVVVSICNTCFLLKMSMLVATQNSSFIYHINNNFLPCFTNPCCLISTPRTPWIPAAGAQ